MIVWIHSPTKSLDGHVRSLREVLYHRGIETRDYDWNPNPGSGLLLTASSDESVCKFVRQASFGGNNRVLVLAVAYTPDRDGGTWELLRSGASDVMTWDGTSDIASDIAARLERWASVDSLLDSPVVTENLVGRSPAWLHILRQIVEIARFTTASVLITGESGTGKELIAQLIHTLDSRPRKKELVVLDCTTVVPELSGSEFFGHERGAYTGAVGPRDGAFSLADGGTLFLDEVGELPYTLQAELLRVVQERHYKRVGSNTWQKTEFRLVSASNRELRPNKDAAGFRPDLYYRISNWSCHLPPLRKRREDIPALVDHFVAKVWVDRNPPRVSDEVLRYFVEREYPGNVRELQQLVSRTVHRHTGSGPITGGDLPEDERPQKGSGRPAWLDNEFDRTIRAAIVLGASLREISRAAEDAAVRSAVAEEKGNWHRAAQRLGVTDRALQLRRAAWRSSFAASGNGSLPAAEEG